MSEYGGPEVLELVELPVPEPGTGEVLLRVSRAGLNFAYTHRRTNTYLAPDELPLVPGAEVVGTREDTGDRVVALCGDGGYAEYATAPAALTFPVPDDVDDGRMTTLSEEIARRIEAELQYPGQIKVVLIRETRAVDFAR